MIGDNRLREKMAAVNGQIMCVYYGMEMEGGVSTSWRRREVVGCSYGERAY